MTPEISRRWTRGLPPFDGTTICLPEGTLVPVTVLRDLLRRLVGCLERDYRSRTLLRAEDWREHDGYVSEPRGCSWDDTGDPGLLQGDFDLTCSREMAADILNEVEQAGSVSTAGTPRLATCPAKDYFDRRYGG